jgi:hypothetical protein
MASAGIEPANSGSRGQHADHSSRRSLTYNFIAAILARTIVPIVLCNTVYYAVLLMMND